LGNSVGCVAGSCGKFGVRGGLFQEGRLALVSTCSVFLRECATHCGWGSGEQESCVWMLPLLAHCPPLPFHQMRMGAQVIATALKFAWGRHPSLAEQSPIS